MQQSLPLLKALRELPVSPFLLPDVQIQSKFPQVACTRIPGWSGGATHDFGEQWGLFQARGSQAASLPWRPFLEGLWEVSLLVTSGPVETARALLSVGRRCCVFRWRGLGLSLQKA